MMRYSRWPAARRLRPVHSIDEVVMEIGGRRVEVRDLPGSGIDLLCGGRAPERDGFGNLEVLIAGITQMGRGWQS